MSRRDAENERFFLFASPPPLPGDVGIFSIRFVVAMVAVYSDGYRPFEMRDDLLRDDVFVDFFDPAPLLLQLLSCTIIPGIKEKSHPLMPSSEEVSSSFSDSVSRGNVFP